MLNMKVAFYTDKLSFRGTGRALIDYARYNESILHNESIIISEEKTLDKTTRSDREFFSTSGLPLFMVNQHCSLDDILEEHNIDVVYSIKYGKKDNVGISNKIKSVVHCVFDLSEPHGDVYAAVSQSLAHKFKQTLFVPHMISMEPTDGDNMKKELNIPDNAIVFGRHGGLDTFNIKWAANTISRIVRERPDIYFLFVNTPRWDNHPQIINLEPIICVEKKKKFIRTCDAMVVPESLGHTFGLAIAEFSIYNKPVICYNGNVWNTEHLRILGDKGIYFHDTTTLYNTLKNFKPEDYKDKDLNAYREYNPSSVMKIFNDVFLK
jgi:hypothetical protein